MVVWEYAMISQAKRRRRTVVYITSRGVRVSYLCVALDNNIPVVACMHISPCSLEFRLLKTGPEERGRWNEVLA